MLPLEPCSRVDETFATIAERIVSTRNGQNDSAVMLMAGAHVLRSGVQRFLIDLMERGLLSCIALNGAGMIHDYELALIGATTESVANYIKDGRFGLWQETGVINDIISDAAGQSMGLGEAVGRFIEEEQLPHREISILAAGYRLGIPVPFMWESATILFTSIPIATGQPTDRRVIRISCDLLLRSSPWKAEW